MFISGPVNNICMCSNFHFYLWPSYTLYMCTRLISLCVDQFKYYLDQFALFILNQLHCLCVEKFTRHNFDQFKLFMCANLQYLCVEKISFFIGGPNNTLFIGQIYNVYICTSFHRLCVENFYDVYKWTS